MFQLKKCSQNVSKDEKCAKKAFIEKSLNLLSTGQNEDFEKILKLYFCENVTKFFKPKSDPIDWSYDEEAIKTSLFESLTNILSGKCGSDLSELSKSLNLSQIRKGQLCGKVFRNGEATYSCRECATDPTCVLCYDCFSHSVHRKHKYKMASSGGTGYCDCGDAEAWKVEPYCTTHAPQFDDIPQKTGQDASDVLPEDVHSRFMVVVRYLIEYAVELICWEYSDILPAGLTPQPMDLPWITMLFNDESHSYDDVIGALTKSIGCTEEKATFLASVVDREGRSSVRAGGKEYCDKARMDIERLSTKNNTKVKLLVETMDSNLVAHQQFAILLLMWINEMIQEFPPLLPIATQIFMKEKLKPEDEHTMLMAVLYKDSKLWKSARMVFHQFIMGSILLNVETKREFSRLFLDAYPTLMNDFISDDHEHGLSIVALTVQIFTVPTIARYLISECNAVCQIIKVLLKHSQKHIDETGHKLKFHSHSTNSNFKRSLHCLVDLKYLLTAPPTESEWTDSLKSGFEIGIDNFLKFINLMHYMNESTRLTTAHQEYESEWETAFNILIRLHPVLSLIQRWCASNATVKSVVFKKVLYKVIASLRLLPQADTIELFGYQISPLKYDVGSQDVSVHIPIHRLLAGLYLNLCASGLHPADNDNFPPPYKLIEMPLRIFVLSAQVTAGMWRRNGYAIPNQLHNYFAPYFRTEMYDKDVLMLQIGGSLIEANEFLLHLINRFDLTSWLRNEYRHPLNFADDTIKNTVILFEEFLNLLIVILSERYLPGVGVGVLKEHVVRREIVQVLCKGPATFSELDKVLPEDHLDETGLSHVVHDVASFKEPTGLSPGMFHLKPEYYRQYSPFYYHFSKTDTSKAEEYQTMLRKSSEDLDIKARPPPELVEFCAPFNKMLQIFNCDVFIQILKLVFTRNSDKNVYITDGHLQRALHLIGMALNEEVHSTNSSDQHRICFTTAAAKYDLYEILDNWRKTCVSDVHNLHLLSVWTLKKFKEVAILHQPASSRIEVHMTSVESGDMNREIESERKRLCREIASKRREKAIEQMQKLQKSFVQKNKNIFESTKTEDENDEDEMTPSGDSAASAVQGYPICLGFNQTGRQAYSLRAPKIQCILCQEDEETADFKTNFFVYAAFVQMSTLYSQSPMKVVEAPDDFDPLYPSADCFYGVHTSTCGHTMHWECFQKLYDSIVVKERKRPYLARFASYYDVDKGEYPCPLCKRLSNTVLPVIPPLKLLGLERLDSDVSYGEWFANLMKLLEPIYQEQKGVWRSCKKMKKRMLCPKKRSKSRSPAPAPEPIDVDADPLDADEAVADDAAEGSDTVMVDQNSFWHSFWSNMSTVFSRTFVDEMKHLFHPNDSFYEKKSLLPTSINMLTTFARAVYTNGLKLPPQDESPRVPILCWLSVAFTVKCFDACLLFEKKPLFGAMAKRQKDCLKALIRSVAITNVISKPSIIRGHVIRLLAPFFDFEHLGPAYPTVLELDIFSVLVELTFSLNWLLLPGDVIWTAPLGGVTEHHLLRLCLTAYCSQLMLSYSKRPASDNEMDSIGGILEGCRFSEFAKRFFAVVGVPAHECTVAMRDSFKNGLVSFLRPAALFFHNLTNVPSPEALHDPSIDEFVPLCRYLGLPIDLDEFVSFLDWSLIEKWVKHPRFGMLVASNGFIHQPLKPNSLIELPKEFGDLINQTTKFKCPSLITDDSRMPTICLLCGAWLCSQSYCCQKTTSGNRQIGACTHHAQYCTAGTGVFLRIRDCRVALTFQQTRGCYMSAPYIDEYGETDFGFRRGNPLFLHADLYRRLQIMWLNQSVPEHIANQLELNGGQLYIHQEWQHL